MASETKTLDKKGAAQAAPSALDKLAGGEGVIVAAGVPEGYDAFLLAAIARRLRFSKRFFISRATISASRRSGASSNSLRRMMR